MAKAKAEKEPELIDAPAEEKLERFDALFRRALSASNVTVQAKMKAEKRLRRARRAKKRVRK